MMLGQIFNVILTNCKLIDHTLEEFNHAVKLVFGHVEQNEITVTGDFDSGL